MHVDRGECSAKLWLDPLVSIAENYGFGRAELRAVERLTRQNVGLLRYEWDAYCYSDSTSGQQSAGSHGD